MTLIYGKNGEIPGIPCLDVTEIAYHKANGMENIPFFSAIVGNIRNPKVLKFQANPDIRELEIYAAPSNDSTNPVKVVQILEDYTEEKHLMTLRNDLMQKAANHEGNLEQMLYGWVADIKNNS